MEKIIHHYLHEQAFGTVVTERRDASSIVCRFPGLNGHYVISVDERDQRTLVVFDGELLFGSLPRSATVIESYLLPGIFCWPEAMRKDPEYACEARPNYLREGEVAGIEIYRHFLLLPSCTAIVRKFRNKSLSPIYVIINVFTNSKGTRVVEWQTTSY